MARKVVPMRRAVECVALDLPKPTADDIRRAYGDTGSVWRAAALLGISGQHCSRLMKRFGIETNKRWLTDKDIAAIRSFYETHDGENFDLAAFAKSMGRTKALIAREAQRLGLTRRNRIQREEVRKASGRKLSAIWREKGHPRGALGMKHTDETKAVLSTKSKVMWATAKTFGIGAMSEESRDRRSIAASLRMANTPAEKMHTRAAGGRRKDLGDIWFRSSWEANYARYLNLLIRLGVVEWWKYESKTFWFEAIKRGVRSYKIDFEVKYKNEKEPAIVEIKGWMDAKSKTKLKRMAKYHPNVKIELIGAKEYRALKNKWASQIEHWETR